MKSSIYKKNIFAKSQLKKENTLDYYITHNLADKPQWKLDGEREKSNNHANASKIQFLKQNVKATTIIPEDMKKSKESPNNFGYFESGFGTVSVGYKKYKKNSDIAFSLIPEDVKKENHIIARKPESANAYFGGELKGKKKHFRASKLSFKYDPQMREIEKLEDDQDGIVDEESKLLYQDKREEEEIENLQKERANAQINQKYQIDKEIADIKEIQEEKDEDNLAFLKEIKGFIEKMKKGKIKKIIESDEAVSRSKRIKMLSKDSDIVFLKKILEEMLKEKAYEKRAIEFADVNLDKLTKEQLKSIIQMMRSHGDKT